MLAPSRLEDPPDKVGWADNHWTTLSDGRASIELVDGHIYLAMSLRNVGAGSAVLQGWHPTPECRPGAHAELEQFRRQGRDLFVPAGGLGFWQGAVRDGNDVYHPGVAAAIQQRRRFAIELLYSDHEAASAPSACSRSPPATSATILTSGCARSPDTGTSSGPTHARRSTAASNAPPSDTVARSIGADGGEVGRWPVSER